MEIKEIDENEIVSGEKGGEIGYTLAEKKIIAKINELIRKLSGKEESDN